jgi:uncharacterized protein YbjT (DUF2867 family)
MKVLAIGGAGHVGSEVVKELLKRNVEVDVLIRKEESLRKSKVTVPVIALGGACSLSSL